MLVPDPVAVHNERVKLLSGSLNAIGLGLIGVAVVRPLVENGATLSLWWSVGGLALHAAAYYVLRRMKRGGPL